MPGPKLPAIALVSRRSGDFSQLGRAAALAQRDYPNRPVRLIVGFIPGSAADITARVLGQRWARFSASSSSSKPGRVRRSSLAAEFVARAPKDGYTLFIASSANITNQAINPGTSVRHDQGLHADRPRSTPPPSFWWCPAIGVKNLRELIALAKSKPGEILYASTGVGTAPHLSGEL